MQIRCQKSAGTKNAHKSSLVLIFSQKELVYNNIYFKKFPKIYKYC